MKMYKLQTYDINYSCARVFLPSIGACNEFIHELKRSGCKLPWRSPILCADEELETLLENDSKVCVCSGKKAAYKNYAWLSEYYDYIKESAIDLNPPQMSMGY